MDQLIAASGTAFVVCGGAGAILPDLALGHVIVPTAAVRDEGTSFHYAPPSRTIAADPVCADTAVRVPNRSGIPHRIGPVWTTDAAYRKHRTGSIVAATKGRGEQGRPPGA